MSFGLGDRNNPEILPDLFRMLAGAYVATLTGNVSLDSTYPAICKLDPGGSNRDVTLDAETDASGPFASQNKVDGLVRLIVNAADGAENLVVKNDGASTIGTLNQNEAGLFICNGGTWTLICIFTIALS